MPILHRQRERHPNDFGEGGGAVVRSVILCIIMPILHKQRGRCPNDFGEGGGGVVQSVILGLSKHANEHNNRHLVRIDIDQSNSLSLIIKHEYCILELNTDDVVFISG